MPLIATGLNHRTADVALRERVAFPADSVSDALRELVEQPGVEEGLIVSTCNRTDIYTVGANSQQVQEWLARRCAVNPNDLQQHAYSAEGTAAAKHALRVACGLDSMVLGETQIFGQMKSSWRQARELGMLGPVLERLFQHAFGTAKVVRHSTALGAGQVSVASSAARIASEIFGSLQDRDILVLGAGETADLMIRYLHAMGHPRMTIANRGLHRAQKLAESVDGAACALDAVPSFLSTADVIVGCVAIERPILDRAQLKAAFGRRKRKPVLMLDLGVPRNFNPDCANDPDVFLYGVDDLQSRVDAGAASRKAAAEDAERIVDSRSREFGQWLLSRELDLGLRALDREWHGQMEPLLQRALGRLQAGDDPEQVLTQLEHRTRQSLLHRPRTFLRELPPEHRARAALDIHRVFGVDDNLPPSTDN